MRFQSNAGGPALALAVALAIVQARASGAAQGAGEPFAAGIEWSDAADAAAPWVPRDVAFAGGEELIWAGRSFSTPAVVLLGAQEELPGPLLASDPSWAGVVAPLEVESTQDGLWALGQFSEGGARRARVARYAPAIGGLAPVWIVDLPSTADGAARLAAAGDGLLCAEQLAGGQGLRLTALDPASGALRWSLSLAGGTLRSLDLSADGLRALVLVGTRVHFVDVAQGLLELTRVHDPAPRTSSLAGDGSRAALGFQARVELWSSAASATAPDAVLAGSGPDVAVALDLEGTLLGVGWWDASTGRRVTLDLWSEPGAGGPFTLDQRQVWSAAPPAPQNFVSAVRARGDRVAFGLWGFDGDEPELVVLERGAAAPVLSADLGGSVEALDVDARLERVAVARKQGHANWFGTTGAVELIDTGERDLSLSRTPVGGSVVTVTLDSSGALAAFLMVGRPQAPESLVGLDGLLALDPSAPITLVPAPASAAGHAATLAVPASALGLEFALQGVLVEPGPSLRLTRTAVASTVL